MGQYIVYTEKGPKRKTVYGKTRAEISEKLHEALANRGSGLIFDDENVTVGEYVRNWLADCVKDTVKASTYSSYERLAEKHAVPYLSRIKLKSINATHIRSLLREKLDAGLSGRTVQYLRFILRKALDQAVTDRRIPFNPVLAVKSPQVTRDEIKPLSETQVRALLRAARDANDRHLALYVVAIHCGLRQG